MIQCHDIEFGNLEQIAKETLPALLKLKQEGLVKAVGITSISFKAIKRVLELAEPGSVETVLNYCRSNLQNRSLETDLFPYLEANGHNNGIQFQFKFLVYSKLLLIKTPVSL